MEEKREKNRVSIIGSEIQNVLYAYVDIAKYNMYSWKDDSIDRTHVEKSNVETAERLDRDAKKCWDEFYKENETNFYKDRHYLHHVFEGIIQNDAKTRRRGPRRAVEARRAAGRRRRLSNCEV